MSRRPLALALVLALLPAAAQADDLLQSYTNARNSDPQYAAAESNRAIAAERPVQARAVLLPQVNGSVGYDLANRGDIDDDGDSDGTSRSASWGLSGSQSIFDYGNYTALRAAKALDRAGGFDLEAAGLNLITRTSAAYFNVLVQLETLSAAEAAETALKKQFDFASKRLEVGLAPITDVHEARAQYDGARANTILARNAVQDAYQALVEITGEPVASLKGLPDDFKPALPEALDVEGWVATALATNPSLKAQAADLEAAEHNIATARSGHYPTLGLRASYGKALPGLYDNPSFFGNNDANTSVGLTLSIPIFSGFATQSNVRSALAQRDISRDQLEQQRRALERNTRNAYQGLVAGISEVEARRLALFSAQSAYEASQVGLEVGTRTVLDVLNNQRTLFSAQQAYAQSKYNFLQSRLLLEQAAGTLEISDVEDVNRLLTTDESVAKVIAQ
ncbi:TolC family outer membrane protein [Thermomonas carbonis]|uniref:TolC family outer membrane protein n=1 Tax=Thermomonas carbonis TaxID=1463158 RepID=A0A7G9SRS1_9GAMM|nr:TolC family outer membrane protein [Thermomonas carbonis]QNN70546.1 TolC family outer membrane protein [Thermomonas carbonis]GHC00697.1 membrane protein [Thermomonas carbonis]